MTIKEYQLDESGKLKAYRIFGYETVKPESPLLQRIQKMQEYDPYVEEIRKESAYQNKEVDLTNRLPPQLRLRYTPSTYT